ncbi:MAG: hypothetical protein D6798_03915 [Deltaproteobacteria bacterium]|nr:MAG: hypothetical protein D6798_03915 [Deltaproteobacteria bacterium]
MSAPTHRDAAPPDAATRPGPSPSRRGPEGAEHTPPDPRLTRLGPWLAAFLALALAIGVTWPAVLDPTRIVIGHPGNDTWNHIWGHWWVSYELQRGRWPLQTELVNHPRGGTLFYIDTVQALMMLPVTRTLGAVAAYNATMVLGLALSGLGAWLLARRVTGDGVAAGIALVAYGAAPHLLGQTYNGISETVCAGWLPLTLWALVRLMDRSTWGRALLLGFLGGMTMLTSWYYGLLAALGGLLLVGWRALGQRLSVVWSRFLPRALGSAAVALAMVVPMLLVFRASLSAEDAVVTRDPEFVWRSLLRHNVTDLAAFFTPTKVPSPDLKALYGEELIIVIYLGWILILLVAFAWTATRRRRELAPWLWLGVVFFAFALGPYLNVGGDYRTIFGHRIPLPFLAFFKAFPLFDRISHPFRFTTGVSLALAVSAAVGLRHLIRRQSRWVRVGITGALGAGLLVETAVASPARLPVPCGDATIPDAYVAMREDPVPGAVLDLPLTVPNLERAIYVWYQSAHRRPIPWGLNDPMPDPLIENRLTATLIRLEAERAWSPPPLYPELDLVVAADVLRRQGYRYIVVHEALYPTFKRDRVEALLTALFGEPTRWTDDRLLVYTLIPPVADAAEAR